MSELRTAVEELVRAHEPDVLPAFARLRSRRRRRQRLRAGAAVVAAAGLAVGVGLAGQSDPPRRDVVTVSTPSPSPAPESLAQQLPRFLTNEGDQHTWTRDGQEVSTNTLVLIVGPSHCDAERTLWLLGRGTGSRASGFIRDPGRTAEGFAAGTFLGRAALPAGATFTGYSLGSAQLWTAADRDRYAYLVNADDPSDVERWPALRGLCA